MRKYRAPSGRDGSIEDVAGIVINLVGFQELNVFRFEIHLFMVFFLCPNVPNGFGQLGGTGCKGRVPGLPGKRPFLLADPFDDPPFNNCIARATSIVAGREISAWTWLSTPPDSTTLNS